MIDVCLLGTGGMLPLPNRYLTSLLLRYQGKSLLVDCGEGTQVAISQYAWAMNTINTICFTHFHGDHVAGISGLLSTISSEGRTEPIHILGPKNVEWVIAQICVVVHPTFDIFFHEIHLGEIFSMEDLKIRPIPVNHSVPCFAYRFDLPRKPKFLPEKAKDIGLPVHFWGKLQEGLSVLWEGRNVEPKEVLGPERKGLSLLYSTDTRPTESLEEACQNVDLAILEGIYGDEEKQKSAVEKKHMTSQEACHLAKRARPKELWLTHYSPSFRDQSSYDHSIKGIYPQASFGWDGRTKTLKFEE